MYSEAASVMRLLDSERWLGLFFEHLGSAGTVKTVTSAVIVLLVFLILISFCQVLVCAPSNVAVDQLAET